MRPIFRNASKLIFFVSMIVIFAAMPMIAVHAMPAGAAPPVQETQAADLPSVFETLKNLGGLALLFTAAINSLKKFGVVGDAQAPAFSLVFNTVALVGIVALQLTGKADVIPVIDAGAGTLATALTAVVALVYQLFVSRKAHDAVLKGLPVIGTSFSNK